MRTEGTNDTKSGVETYIELSKDVYNSFIAVLGSVSRRRLEYWKSLWEVASRPYLSTSIDSRVSESIDRMSNVVDLTADRLKADGQDVVEFSEQVVSYGSRFQDAGIKVMRGVLDTSISSLDYVKESTQHQFEDLTNRLEEVERRTSGSVTSNN